MTLYLVRHGQTAVNAGGRLQGRVETELTDLGHQQAQAIAASVPRPALVVSSPLRRAQQTASYFETEVVVDERWIELDYGDLEGMRISDVAPATWASWRSDLDFAPPAGESLRELGARVREACDELVAIASGQDVVVVTHVSPLKAAVAWALGGGDELAWRMFVDVAAIARVAVGERGPTLTGWNDTSHLRGLG